MFLYELLTLHQPFVGCETVKELILEGGRPPLTPRELSYPTYMLDLMIVSWSHQVKHTNAFNPKLFISDSEKNLLLTVSANFSWVWGFRNNNVREKIHLSEIEVILSITFYTLLYSSFKSGDVDKPRISLLGTYYIINWAALLGEITQHRNCNAYGEFLSNEF